MLLRGPVLNERGLVAAGRIAAATGARLLCDTFAPRLQRGAGRVAVERIPYFAEQIVEFLADVEQLVLVGTKPPVSFFAYPGKKSWCTPEDTEILYLAHPHEDGVAAVEAVVDALGATTQHPTVADHHVEDPSSGPLDRFTVGKAIAFYLPEGAILSDEGGTSGLGTTIALATAVPYDHLSLTGGSIGQGLPVATGAAVACPDRKVVCIEGDGAAMYTLQSLWTQARERLDVTTVLFANRSYAILNIELKRVGATPGPRSSAMLDLSNPVLDWVKLAQGMGVVAERVESLERFREVFRSAMDGKGPRLIEVVL